MPGQTSDSVVVLAALSSAEGDVDRARILLAQMGAGREPGLIAYSRHLAALLGVEPEHIEQQRHALTYGPRIPRESTAHGALRRASTPN